MDIQKRVQKFVQDWCRTPSKNYYLFLFVMVIVYVGMFIQSSVTSTETNIVETALNEKMTLNQIEIEVVDRRLNPETRLFEMDFLVSKQPTEWLMSHYLDATVRVKSDPSKPLKSELNKINDFYYVLLVEDIPKGFEAISVSIEEVNKKDKDANQRRSISFYTVEKKEWNDEKLQVLAAEDYEKKAIDQSILRVERMIKEIDQHIQELEKENILYEKEATKVQEKMTYQTENEQLESQSELEHFTRKMEENENEKMKYESEKMEHQNKIELLEKQKRDEN